MDKRKLHHNWTRFQTVKPWYFLVMAVLSGLICISALRANNQHMAQLRDAVYAADKNDTNVEQALRNLQNYVTHHMNTNLTASNSSVYPPIQLKYTYERLSQAQSGATDKNSQIYTDAQHYCEAQNSHDFSGRNRVPCIEQYVSSHSRTTTPKIPDALYKFDFVSPVWSPDLAGWTLPLTVVLLFLLVLSVVSRWWLRKASS